MHNNFNIMPNIKLLSDAILVDETYIPRTSLLVRAVGDRLSIFCDGKPILAEMHYSKVSINGNKILSIDDMQNVATKIISEFSNVTTQHNIFTFSAIVDDKITLKNYSNIYVEAIEGEFKIQNTTNNLEINVDIAVNGGSIIDFITISADKKSTIANSGNAVKSWFSNLINDNTYIITCIRNGSINLDLRKN